MKVLTATGDDLTNTEDPFKVAMRQIASAFVQLEKARLVFKLRAARERKRKTRAAGPYCSRSCAAKAAKSTPPETWAGKARRA